MINIFKLWILAAVILMMPSLAMAHGAPEDGAVCHSHSDKRQHCHLILSNKFRDANPSDIEVLRSCMMEMAQQCATARGGRLCLRTARRLCGTLGNKGR